MADQEWLAEQFEANRTHLRSVAYRMLGSAGEADDAVQESWLRLARADTSDVTNLGGWLTTVVARVCLDMLRSRKSRREASLDESVPETAADPEASANPEQEALLADSVGLAMLVVLETLPPAERVALVLHDMFDVPFDQIAPIVGRTPTATRKLASRARGRVRGAERDPQADLSRQQQVVRAFLAAARGGDFAALLELLDPDVVLRPDPVALRMAARSGFLTAELRGAKAVAERFSGAAQAARPALIDGAPGATWAPGGTPRTVFSFTIEHGRIVAIDLLADPERLGELEVVIQDA